MASILRVKEILKNKNKSLTELANDMGINRVTLSNMINGNPTLDTLNKIASFLKVELVDLFLSVAEDSYTVAKDKHDNYFNYEDDNISLSGFLPHFTQRDYGSFKLDIKRKDFSIVPSTKGVYELLKSDKTIEETVFMGEHNNEVLIQLFYSFTSLNKNEYKSLCSALKTYFHYYKECYNEILNMLETETYDRKEFNSDYFILGEIKNSTWNKLIELTKHYDLDTDKNDFEKFNATGRAIIMYNRNIESGYNIKTWISPIEDKSFGNQVTLGWYVPSRFDRNKILTNEIFTAKESYDFLHNVMIPKAMSLKEKKKRKSIF